jgi:mevalonate kinase
LASPLCVGAISRDCDFFVQYDQSLSFKTFSPGAARKMVESKRNGTTIINTGNNNQIAGRDMSQVYQNIAQTNDPEMARAIAEIGRIVEEEGNEETKEQFAAFAEELEKANPKPGLLKAIWNSMSQTLPKIAEIATAVGSLAGILGLR